MAATNTRNTYRIQLRQLPAWEEYLRQESHLPGPRANLELLQAVVEVGDRLRFVHLLALEEALPEPPQNNPDEFVTICAVAGLGKLVAEGDVSWLAELRRHATDPRWRVREAVAIALQYVGDQDMPLLLQTAQAWRESGPFEQRAVVAALAEPRLLRDTSYTAQILAIFDAITQTVAAAGERRTPAFRALRQALGYGWSVLVAAQPQTGWPALERRLAEAARTRDKDLLWIMRENLKKQRLRALDAQRVAYWRERLA